MSNNQVKEQIKNLLERNYPGWAELKSKELVLNQLTRSVPDPATPESTEVHVLKYIANEPPF